MEGDLSSWFYNEKGILYDEYLALIYLIVIMPYIVICIMIYPKTKAIESVLKRFLVLSMIYAVFIYLYCHVLFGLCILFDRLNYNFIAEHFSTCTYVYGVTLFPLLFILFAMLLLMSIFRSIGNYLAKKHENTL